MSETKLNKFRGTLIGALVGDCTGRRYEFAPAVKKGRLLHFFNSCDESTFEGILKYSDDSIMTIGIAESIVEMKKVDPVDIAKRFVSNFFKDPKRGYGRNVKRVFEALKETDCSGDVFGPAKLQFDGSGSFGNGGAMRISPVSLFYCDDYNLMLEMAEKSSLLTHTHEIGINGALLQAICVYKCFHHDSERPIDVYDFVQDLITKMKAIEHIDKKESSSSNLVCCVPYNKHGKANESPTTYCNQLKKVEALLKQEDVTDGEVKANLGNGSDESALYSVPTAVYCFLRAQKPIPELETDNVFRRTISYCISLGGDTDTIASMAGAMCGAYLGISCISKGLQDQCEAVEEMRQLSDKLYSLKFSSSSSHS